MKPSRPALGSTSSLHQSYPHRQRVAFSTPLSLLFSLSPPDRPVSQPRKLDPAWARVGRILHAAHRPAAAASALAASLRPFANNTCSAHRSAACPVKNFSRHRIVRQDPAVCFSLPQELEFSSRNPLRSSTSSTLYIFPLIAGALLVYIVTSDTSDPLTAEEEIYRQSYSREHDEDMAALPGRPGNLTLEEEEKLRKFWDMFLQICGVFDEDGAEGETPTPLAEQQKTLTASSDKPKKKRLNPFKKRKDKGKENKAADKDAANPVAKENDPEDKWGESKAYYETLAKHTPEEIRATIWSMVKHDNPDALLLRFLRARKWDLQRALVMMVSTMNWRASEMRVDTDVMVKGEEHASIDEKNSDESVKKPEEDFLAQMRLGKSYCYGIDKAGRPICVCRARLHKAGEQSEASLERYTVYLIETTRFLLSPPVDTGVRPYFVHLHLVL